MAKKIDVFRRRSDGAYTVTKLPLELSWAPFFVRDHRHREIYSLRHSPIGRKESAIVVDDWDGYVNSVADPTKVVPNGRALMMVDQGRFFPHTFEEWSAEDKKTDYSLIIAIRDQTAKARASARHLGNSVGLLTNWVAIGGIAVLVLVFVAIVLTVFLGGRVGAQ